MAAEYLVIGHFSFVDEAARAVARLREKGFGAIESYSPVPDHLLEDEVYRGRVRSPVRMFTLLGGLTGCLGAFLFTSWMSIDWPLRTSAKPLISIPAFVVVGFECTILLGGIFTLLSMLCFTGIPRLKKDYGFRPNFSEGTFGLSIRVPEPNTSSVKEILEGAGASKVEVQYVR